MLFQLKSVKNALNKTEKVRTKRGAIALMRYPRTKSFSKTFFVGPVGPQGPSLILNRPPVQILTWGPHFSYTYIVRVLRLRT